MPKPQNIRIIKDEEKPETPELLADSIIRIADAFTSLSRQGLMNHGIVALLKAMPGMNDVSVPAIRLTLENLPKLKGYYIRK